MSDTSHGVRPSRLILLILIAAGGASILSTDHYAPSLPHLPAYFGTDAETVQLTMALNMASFAIAQLFWGPLSDRFGRRAIFIPAWRPSRRPCWRRRSPRASTSCWPRVS